MSNSDTQLFKLEGTQICVVCDSDESKPELGTGFVFLRPDWIVTAAHVVIENEIPRGNIYVHFPINGNNKHSVKVLAVHKENDIALLKIQTNPSPCTKPLYPGYDDLSVSKGLVCCGYTPTKGQTITISLAKVYEKSFRERERVETVLEFESNDIEGGSSGGPIFGDGGVVLGLMINTYSMEEEPNKKFARATSILNLMEAINIDFDAGILKIVE